MDVGSVENAGAIFYRSIHGDKYFNLLEVFSDVVVK